MPVGDIQANCYVISVNERALIVDPGAEGNKIIQYLTTQNLKPEAILMTHGHFDHIGALEEVQATYDIPVYAHQDEQAYLTKASYNLSWKSGRTPIEIKDLSAFVFIQQEETIELLGQSIDILHVPGHSLGSIAFYFKAAGMVLTGDALFKGSIGRTDMIHGNHDQLITSITSKLFTLPDETVVYPGHGLATMIGDEKKTNPFFR